MGIVITEQNKLVLETLAKYYVLTRQMIQQMCFPHVRSPRSVCERLRKLKNEGYLSQAKMQIVLQGQNAVPIYHPNKKTAQTLAAVYGDDSYLNIHIKPPSNGLLFHWIEISKTHHIVRQAVEGSELLEMPNWFNEWETINKDEPQSQFHFSLFSPLREKPPLSCAPDAGFLIDCNGHRKVFYVEVDRGTDSIRRIASKKPPGYAAMETQKRHLKHFPDSTLQSFSILFITTTQHRRDDLASRLKDLDGHHLWRLAYRTELTSESFFHSPVWLDSKGDATSLIAPV